jgi:hypothetical protein
VAGRDDGRVERRPAARAAVLAEHDGGESIYTHDPNGYLIEITMPLRPVTLQEDLDANLTIDALLDVVAEPDPTLGKLLARKAELIADRAPAWELARAGQEAGR